MKEKVKYMEKSKKKNKITKWAAGVYIALLISFSSFVVMDTFVIEKTLWGIGERSSSKRCAKQQHQC